MRLILIGPPGSGKGTQGNRLAQTWGVPHIASGDIIREHIAHRTEFGRRVEAAIAAGEFAPDADISYWIAERLSHADSANGWILDGFPRNIAQARAFDAEIDTVIELLIPAEALIERLAGRLVCPACEEIYHSVHHPSHVDGICDNDGSTLNRRPDDSPEAIRHRFFVYQERTLPLRSFYHKHGLLKTVDADANSETVFARIESAVCIENQKI